MDVGEIERGAREAIGQAAQAAQQAPCLASVGQAAQRVGQMGLQIGEEIELQSNMIGDLDEEVDTAKSRLNVAKRMMDKVRT